MGLKKLGLEDLDVKGKRVLVRVDYNVPLNEKGEITNDKRIRATLPTLETLLEKGCQSLVLISHLGRPEGRIIPEFSLFPVSCRLEELLKRKVVFLQDCVGPEVEKVCAHPELGTIILLENLRFHPEEEVVIKDEKTQEIIKQASEDEVKLFRTSLTRLGDIYVNDAFGTAHRKHSSIVGIDLPQRAAGLLLKKELDYFAKVLENPEKPYIAILGGKKISDKIPIIKNFLPKVNKMIISGGMAYTFLKIMHNMNIGDSLFDTKGAESVQTLLEIAKKHHVELFFPVDFVIADTFDKNANTKVVTIQEGIEKQWMGLDIGPRSGEIFAHAIADCKTIMWNGPAGVFEWEKFESGTKAILDAVVKATKENNATSIVGGGDTGTVAKNFGQEHAVSHISTGGGASLKLLEGQKLPGVTALTDI